MKPSDVLDLAALYEASYSRELPDDTRQMWCKLLADVERNHAFAALNEIAAVSNFPPTPQHIRLRALELGAGIADFGEVWSELVEAASTCDYFDPRPPSTLSRPAHALARQLGWADFRVSDPTDTYYVHAAQQRYTDIVSRAQRNLGQGLPAFDTPFELPEGDDMRSLVEGIGHPEEDA